MSLRWDSDVLNHTSANGICGFEMTCVFFFFFLKDEVLTTCWSHTASKKQSQDLRLLCQIPNRYAVVNSVKVKNIFSISLNIS